ncbi:hypothetical protein CASFOL_037495 [Castilleja foliolosa]|uniref:RNase H type-1 domain-containing protein n=1 Tax=Castilleja foliolosa TaxID=1961234 RepID=A0ABD3BNJ5_9LAMI
MIPAVSFVTIAMKPLIIFSSTVLLCNKCGTLAFGISMSPFFSHFCLKDWIGLLLDDKISIFASPSMKAGFLLFTVILYESIWFARNKLTHGFSAPSVQELVVLVSRKCKEHWTAMAQLFQGNALTAKAWTKVSTDAAYSDGVAFIGVVFRNNNGSILFAAAFKHHCLDSLSAESLAILDGCIALDNHETRLAILESDCLTAVSFINVPSSNKLLVCSSND